MKIFSVDAETDGLYGEIWAIGACVYDTDGPDIEGFAGQLAPNNVVTDPWVRENIVPKVNLPRFQTGLDLLNAFWDFWMRHRDDSICVVDFGAPVEAFLYRCAVEINPAGRMWSGPYPMHELGTALLLAGEDPDVNRREYIGRPDLVQHNPYDDALAAALCWIKATALITDRMER